MKLDTTFTFGKYKGLTLQEVYQGTLTPDRNLIRLYLDKILNNIHPHIPLSNHFVFIDRFIVTENTIEVVGTQEFWETDVGSNGESIGEVGEVFLGNLQDTLKQIINCHFNSTWLGIVETLPEFNASQEQRVKIGGDPQYLEWCMRHVDGFQIGDKAMEELMQLSYCELSGVDVMYISHNLYEYVPIIKVRQPYFKKPDLA